MRPLRVAGGLAGLVLASLLLRLEGQGVSLWLDEGISIGIASHPAADIPGLLVQDGSPPLYYLLLHGWMRLFGDGPVAVRSLSLLAALAMVPVAYWAGRSLFGSRSGWIAAALAATSPYLSLWGRDARMYTLLALLALVAVTAFLHAFAFGRRRWIPAFVVSLALVCYTHNWGLYLAAASALAAVVCALRRPDTRRALLDVVLAFTGVALLYAPWVPTLARQVSATGAPWSTVPVLREAVSALGSVLGDERVLVALLVAGTVPLAVLARQRHTGEGRAVVGLAVVVAASVSLAWVGSQIEPGWSARYFGIFLAPLLVLAALALSRAGGAGLVAFGLIVVFWTQPLGRVTGARATPTMDDKGNVEEVSLVLETVTRPGDLVISTQIEHVPLLYHYFGDDLRYAIPMGLVADPQVVDWRYALDRMEASTPATGLEPLVDDLGPGAQIILVCPRLTTEPGDLTWSRLMDLRCREWRQVLDADPTLALRRGPFPKDEEPEPGTSVFVLVYEKRV
ncbi:MAG: glycosyltransferase family 39 protein [Actinomycetota bacterium]|nr:glycosyltransferase family 39 protein [Actinomycetota bacterium]